MVANLLFFIAFLFIFSGSLLYNGARQLKIRLLQWRNSKLLTFKLNERLPERHLGSLRFFSMEPNDDRPYGSSTNFA